MDEVPGQTAAEGAKADDKAVPVTVEAPSASSASTSAPTPASASLTLLALDTGTTASATSPTAAASSAPDVAPVSDESTDVNADARADAPKAHPGPTITAASFSTTGPASAATTKTEPTEPLSSAMTMTNTLASSGTTSTMSAYGIDALVVRRYDYDGVDHTHDPNSLPSSSDVEAREAWEHDVDWLHASDEWRAVSRVRRMTADDLDAHAAQMRELKSKAAERRKVLAAMLVNLDRELTRVADEKRRRRGYGSDEEDDVATHEYGAKARVPTAAAAVAAASSSTSNAAAHSRRNFTAKHKRSSSSAAKTSGRRAVVDVVDVDVDSDSDGDGATTDDDDDGDRGAAKRRRRAQGSTDEGHGFDDGGGGEDEDGGSGAHGRGTGLLKHDPLVTFKDKHATTVPLRLDVNETEVLEREATFFDAELAELLDPSLRDTPRKSAPVSLTKLSSVSSGFLRVLDKHWRTASTSTSASAAVSGSASGEGEEDDDDDASAAAHTSATATTTRPYWFGTHPGNALLVCPACTRKLGNHVWVRASKRDKGARFHVPCALWVLRSSKR